MVLAGRCPLPHPTPTTTHRQLKHPHPTPTPHNSTQTAQLFWQITSGRQTWVQEHTYFILIYIILCYFTEKIFFGNRHSRISGLGCGNQILGNTSQRILNHRKESKIIHQQFFVECNQMYKIIAYAGGSPQNRVFRYYCMKTTHGLYYFDLFIFYAAASPWCAIPT